jgi:hypothetical protein
MIWGGGAHPVPAVPAAMQIGLAFALLVIGYTVGRRRRAPRWLAGIVAIAAALLPIAAARATTFTVPFTFTNGTVADATQVNQNFATVSTEVDRLRKQTAVVTDCAFRPHFSQAQTICGTGQGGIYITNGYTGELSAPLYVPQGATITSAEVWVSDTNATQNIQVCLKAELDNAGFFDATGPCASTSGAPGIVKLTITPQPALTHGVGEAFQIAAFSVDGGGNVGLWPTQGDSLTVRTAYVHYEVP